MVRTALSSTEKLTERLISISPMRHNCPNTMRKQASDGLGLCIASLLCRATAPTTTSGPFFVSEPRMPELTAGAWAFRRSVPTEIERIVLEGLKKHVPFKKPISKHKRGLLSEPPFFVRQKSFNACGKQPKQYRRWRRGRKAPASQRCRRT